MTIRLSDLSPAARKQVEESVRKGGTEPNRTPKKSPSSRLEGWCVACGEHIPSEPAWDRHVAATGCRRNLRCWPPPGLRDLCDDEADETTLAKPPAAPHRNGDET